MKSAAFTVGVAVLWAASSLEGQQAAQDLEGAWRVTEVVTTGPIGRTLSTPQPGLLLFTGDYYSYIFVTTDQPRMVPSRGLSSAEEMLDIWSPFTANAGTFEVSSNRMIRRPVVAKSPETMVRGTFNEYTFRLSADTLWVTTVGTEGGPARNPTTVQYVRTR